MRHESEKYIVRFPEGMRDRIKVRAAMNRRSMNSEIVLLLERALETNKATGKSLEASPVASDATQSFGEGQSNA